jgi:hypothetical protein
MGVARHLTLSRLTENRRKSARDWRRGLTDRKGLRTAAHPLGEEGLKESGRRRHNLLD